MAAFTLGNIVVYRVGTGTALNGSAAPVFLDEYSPTGALVQSIAVPTADSGTTHALTASGSATSEGLITDSADGSTLLLTGYDAAPGTASIASTTATADPRVVGLAHADGTIDTGTVLAGFLSGNNIRGVASADGSAIYAAGATGVGYTTADSTTAPSPLDSLNTRQIENVGGQLYYSTGSGTAGIYSLGTGAPTSGTQAGTLLPGTGSNTTGNGSSPYAFVFADLSPSVAGNDTLYVADSGKGIEKFSLVNGTWTSNGQIAFSGVTGLTASVSNGTVTLFATSPSSIDTLTDSGGYNAALPGASALKTIASALPNEAFRGVAFAPTGATTTPPPGTTVSIGDTTYVQGSGGAMSAVFTVTRSDMSGAFSLNYATADGTAKAGTDYVAESGTLTFAANGSATQTISVPIDANPNAPASETFNVNLSNITNTSGSATFSDTSATGTIVKPTPIYTIQGSGFTSPLAGQMVTTDGIVTAVGSNGYYLQDATGDGKSETSDGIFVFTSSKPTVAVGDFLDVSGTVQEYKPSSADPGAFSSTELSNVTATTTVSHSNTLPAAVVIGPDGVSPPTSDLASADAFYESLEGMRVTVETPEATGPTNAYGEIVTVADNGNEAPGITANGNILISEGQPNFGYTDSTGGNFNPERIKIDSELVSGAVPAANTGTQFASVTGILNYDFGAFGVSATSPLTVTKASPITPTIGTLTGDATHLTLASYNIENFSVTAQGQAKANAVASQIVNNLKSPDIIALQEVQDNSGPTDDKTISASSNLQSLVTAINQAGGPQYTAIDNPFIGNDTNGGQPGGNIRTAFLYRADRVSFVPGSLATIAANGSAITDQGSAAAAESYLDMGNRGFFKDADVVDLVAGPDADPALHTYADFCRPFVDGGAILDVVRSQMRRRDEADGWTLSSVLDLHLVVDGQRLDPIVRGLTARFQMPAGVGDVWLVSPTSRPCDVKASDDPRDLGVSIAVLCIDDGFGTVRAIAIDDPLLCIGFHEVEDGARRWTAGRARLSAALWEGFADGFFLRIGLAGPPVPRWMAPAVDAKSAEFPRLAIVA